MTTLAKGKVERLIKTIKESFVLEANAAGFTNLAELNEAFRGWLGKYHATKHSEIGETPENRWKKDESKLIAVTPEHLRRALMLRTTRKVQEETGTVYLDGLEYVCSREVAGMTVDVRWHVDYSDWIEIWIDGKYVETARLHERPSSLPYSVAAGEENYQTLASSKAVMEQMRSNSGYST